MFNQLDTLDAIQLRHADIHQNNIRQQPLGELHRFPTIGGGPDDLQLRFVAEHDLQALSDQLLIFGDHHPNHWLTLPRIGI